MTRTEPSGARRSRGRYAFLRTPRWLRVIAVGLLVSVGCAALGYWQWNRHSARLEAVQRVETNYDAAAVPLATLLPEPGRDLRAQDAWRPVTVSGAYADGGTVLLRNRPVAGAPAHHVLVSLVVTTEAGDAAVLVIDRGWVPAGSVDQPGAVPPPPSGAVDVVVRLRPAEAAADRSAPPGQVYAVAPAEVLALSDVASETRTLPVLGGYGVLVAEEPAPATAPRPLPRPDTDLGTHLSYTFQWWVFAIGALVGVVVLARREAAALTRTPGAGAGALARTADGDPGRSAGGTTRRRPGDADPPPRPGARRRRGRAEEEEDALIEAQLHHASAGDALGGPFGDARPHPRSGRSASR